MQTELHAIGFNLTNYTREFVQSKLRYRLGRFDARIAAVAVTLSVRAAGGGHEVAACDILVHTSPHGEIRRRAEHQWLHVAIDRATSAVAAAIERNAGSGQQTRLTAAV